jgi:hypothetical protein
MTVGSRIKGLGLWNMWTIHHSSKSTRPVVPKLLDSFVGLYVLVKPPIWRIGNDIF